MGLIRSLLLFAAIVAVLIFAIGNVDHRTSIRLFTRTFDNVHLNVVLLGAALFGAGLTFAAMLLREFALRRMVRKLRREQMRLDDELTALRNLPLSGLPEPPPAAAEETERR